LINFQGINTIAFFVKWQLPPPRYLLALFHKFNRNMDILTGLQWGDEGKGKIIDLISRDYDIIARFNGGANAGHSIFHNGKRFIPQITAFGNLLSPCQKYYRYRCGDRPYGNPCGGRITSTHIPEAEITNRLLISEKAHLVLPTYKYGIST
jgi:adenylosuccinate synthase